MLRRHSEGAASSSGGCDGMMSLDECGRPMLNTAVAAQAPTAAAAAIATTSFTLADVVQCCHGLGGRCLQCSGRLVQNVPLVHYGAFCEAYRIGAGGIGPDSGHGAGGA